MSRRSNNLIYLPSLDFKYRLRDEYDAKSIKEITGIAQAYAIQSTEGPLLSFIDKKNNFIGKSASTINDAQNNFLDVVRAFLVRCREGKDKQKI